MNRRELLGLSTALVVASAPIIPAVAAAGAKIFANNGPFYITNSMKGQTVVLGGGNFFQINLGSAGQYDADFQVTLMNEDLRGKWIAPQGASPFPLFPFQQTILTNFGSDWLYPQPQRLNINLPIYVDSSQGSSVLGGSDGLAAGRGAFATMQQALDFASCWFDAQSNPIVIKVAPDTVYQENASIWGVPVGTNLVIIEGDGGVFTWIAGSGGVCIQLGDGAEVLFKNVYFNNDGGPRGAGAVLKHQAGVAEFGPGCSFGSFPDGYILISDTGGFVNLTADYAVYGQCAGFANIGPGGILSQVKCTVTVNNNVVTDAWIRLLRASYYADGGASVFNGQLANGTVPYSIDGCSSMMLFGTVIPANGRPQIGTGSFVF